MRPLYPAVGVETRVVDEEVAGIWKDLFSQQDKRSHTPSLSSICDPPMYLKSDISHSNSPQKKKSASSQNYSEELSCGGQPLLVRSGLSHSISPEKRKKRSELGGSQLEPLRYERKHASDGNPHSSSPEKRRGRDGAAGKRPVSLTGRSILNSSVPCSDMMQLEIQERERSRHMMKSSESLPTLAPLTK